MASPRPDETAAGRVDEDVDPAELFDDLLESLLDRLFGRDVAPETDGFDFALFGLAVLFEPLDEVFGGLLGHGLVEVEDGDGVGAGLGESTGDQVAEATGCSGHDADLFRYFSRSTETE